MCNLLTHLPDHITLEGLKNTPFPTVLNALTNGGRILKEFCNDSFVS